MQHRQNDFIFLVGIVAMLFIACTGIGSAEDPPTGTLVTETYVVVPGDTLWSISAKYMDKNSFGRRDIREFNESIIELNYDNVFSKRPDKMIYPGDRLQINYWVSENKKNPLN